MEISGTVICVDKKVCVIYSEGKQYRALYTRRRIEGAYTSQLRPVAVGDDVIFETGKDRMGWLKKILPRKTALGRSATGKDKEQVVVANVEQMCIVSSIFAPPFRSGIIDRLLIGAQRGGLDPIIVLNKADLRDQEKHLGEVLDRLGVYDEIGYPICVVSAVSGEGIPALKERLSGKTTVLAGHSGVGKSALLVAVDPQLELKIHDVSRKSGRGQHTTTRVTLLPLGIGGFVADTPGIREFSLWQVKPEEVGPYFPEIAAHSGACKYKTCLHLPEPDCAVKKAVAEKKIAAFRYGSYCRIVESLGKEKISYHSPIIRTSEVVWDEDGEDSELD